MDYAETQIKAVIQSAIDKLLITHKTHKDNDAGYSQAAYEILHTFMNNIHLTQSLVYSTVISKPFKINPVTARTLTTKTNAESLAQTVINEEELFVPRIIKSGTIPAPEDKKDGPEPQDEGSEFNIDLDCEQTPAISKQQTLDRWVSNASTVNNSHYVHRATPPHRRRHVEAAYASYYGYDNSPPEYYEPNEEGEAESKTGWTYTDADYEGEEDALDRYMANSEFARATTPSIPEEFRNGIANFDMDLQQCCARIGKTIYDVEEKDPEFMDSYPPDTYRDMSGRVYGLPCAYMIPIEDFEKGTIFCPSHLTDYEDIRTAPGNTDANFLC